jgi:hypothetical protein
VSGALTAEKSEALSRTGPEIPIVFRNALVTMKTLRAPLGRAPYRENDWIASDPELEKRG